jgi:hypothetical protein
MGVEYHQTQAGNVSSLKSPADKLCRGAVRGHGGSSMAIKGDQAHNALQT